MAKRVILTGATGFIGRLAIPKLIARGYEVHAVSSRMIEGGRDEVFWHQADLMNAAETEKLFKRVMPSHLLHFAWYVEPGKFWNSEENFKWVESSIRLIRFFKAYGGNRVVSAGTCAEYCWGQEDCYIENGLYDMPKTIYGVAKKITQQLFEAYSQQFQLSVAWGRIFFLYGPNDHPMKFLSSVIISMLQKRIIKCTHGNQMRDFLHVQDVASAFVALLDSPVQGVVNISSGEAHSLKEIVAIAGKYLSASEYVHFGEIDLKNEPPLIKGSNERLLNEVGWAPVYQIEAGILDTVDWWKKSILEMKMR